MLKRAQITHSTNLKLNVPTNTFQDKSVGRDIILVKLNYMYIRRKCQFCIRLVRICKRNNFLLDIAKNNHNFTEYIKKKKKKHKLNIVR